MVVTEIVLSGTQCETVKGAATAIGEVLGVAYGVNKEEATIMSLNIIFVIQTTCVFCGEGNKCLNIIWINLGFKVSRSSVICLRLYAFVFTRVGTLIVATICLQLIQNRYMFRSFTVLHCGHQHCVQPVASDVEVVGYL